MKNWIASMEERLDALGAKLEQKEWQIPVDLTAGIVSLAIAFILFIILPSQYTAQPNDPMDGGTFPKLLILVMAACSAGLIIKEVKLIIQKKPLQMKTINLWVEIKALTIFLLIFIAYLLCKFTDLFVIGGLFLALSFLIYFRCKKPLYYAITLTIAVAIWVVFRFGLGVSF